MRVAIILSTFSFAVIVACSGNDVHMVDSGSSGSNTCAGSAFDPCTSNDQCMSMNCHLYNGAGLQVCTQACTPFDNTTCPVDATGVNGICNMMGNCKPAKANDCAR
jgi:hypothetical protein